MKITDIVKEAVETLRECEALVGVPVILKDAGHLHERIDTDLARRFVCVVVSWSGFTPIIQGDTAPDGKPVGIVGIVARVYETPDFNRSRNGAPTVCDIAIAVADALNCAIAEGMTSPLWLKSIGDVVETGDGSGTVTCDVRFETKASLR